MLMTIPLYILTALSIIYFREKEIQTTVSLFIILLLLMSFYDKQTTTAVFIAAIILTGASYVCVKYYKIWTFNYTKKVLPYWFPVLWMITSLFIIRLKVNTTIDIKDGLLPGVGR